jgi:hypothetical protein
VPLVSTRIFESHNPSTLRPSSSKSISISGSDNDPDSGNAQKQVLHQSLVIFKQYATTDPAADPRPGPTETPILRLQLNPVQSGNIRITRIEMVNTKIQSFLNFFSNYWIRF